MAGKTVWDVLAEEISSLFTQYVPPANTRKIRKAVRDLRILAGHQSPRESDEFMSNPTEPTDLVSISQSVLDGIANAIESAVAALKPLIGAGTLNPADESKITQAVSDLEALEVPATPPVTPPSDTGA